jgi:hypothetical protein
LLDDGRVGHPAALAHRLQAIPPAALFQGVDQRGHDACTAGAERVADCDGAALHVGLGQIRPGVMSPRQRLLDGARNRFALPARRYRHIERHGAHGGGRPAGLAELELGRERRSAAREARRARGQHIGRPKALDKSKAALAQRMHASGESANTIAAALGISRATVYRVLSASADERV